MPVDYKLRILKVFAESYPGSAQFQGGRQLRKGKWGDIFPEINESPDQKEAFISAVEELAAEDIIAVKWIKFNKGNKVDALYLINPDRMYRFIGEESPESIRGSVISFVDGYKTGSVVTAKIIEYIRSNYTSGDKELFNNYADIRDILKLSEVSLEETERFNIRALSIRLFSNSKRIESIKDKADRICFLCGEEPLTVRLGIDRKFPETSLAGDAVIEFQDGEQWTLAGNMLTLPLATVRNIRSIRIPSENPKILSIENKETFHVLSKQLQCFDLFIYCSGRLNSADKLILEILNKNNCAFYHSGDLDPDGLKIFNEIDAVLDNKLQPFRMDIQTYNEYLKYGYELSVGALRQFGKYDNEKLKDLASEILRTGKGVEQEIISYFSGE